MTGKGQATLSARVAAVQLRVTVLTLALVTLGTTLAVSIALSRKTDQQLDAVLGRVTLYLAEKPAETMGFAWLAGEIEEIRPSNVRIEVRDASGRVKLARGNGPQLAGSRPGCATLDDFRACSTDSHRLQIVAARSRADDAALLDTIVAVLGLVSLFAAGIVAFARFEEALEREKRFTAEASHELRTPLTIALAEVEALARGDGDGAEPARAMKALTRLPMFKPLALRSQPLAAIFALQVALVGCRQRGDPSAEAQAPAQAGGPSREPRSIRLVRSGGVGFDDLVYSSESHTVVAPTGATGCVELFASASLAKTQRCGLSAAGDYAGGHGEGVTSADVGAGQLFAVDRTSRSLKVAALGSEQDARGYPLSGEPDYVRWVESRREVWVTEPDQEQIEVFALSDAGHLTRTLTIPVKGGPESLVIDGTRHLAYSHLWSGQTVAIDLVSHRLVAQFANECGGSRGIALDSARGLLFVGCSEGKAVVLDIDHSGRVLDSELTASGVDIIALNSNLNHLYVPAASDGSVVVLGVGPNGTLTRLGSMAAVRGAHCVASDDHSRVWVCSPEAGALLVFDDTFPRLPE